ncbi:MAG: carbon-nitrogen hydrolase family protein [Candidatus Cloacimonadota bacterium]|nr:MAG: carbon-nitrogen hydrolase family protein [Candidatus Cloacimonadota bacterium]
MIIATAQSQIENNLVNNTNEIIRLIQLASEKGANFVHFPEGALSGYAKEQISNWSLVDWHQLENQLKSIQKICKNLNIWVALGSNHMFLSEKRPYNSIYIINNTGNIVARYDKRFCSNSEINHWYNAGSQAVTVKIHGITFGFLLCIEINFPELFMEYEKMGVDCILISSYSKSKMFAIQAQGHAACNNIWISFSTPQNVSNIQESLFIGPDGSIISKCKNKESDLIINQINPSSSLWDIPCKKARPWRTKARLKNIYKVKS